MEGVMHYHRLCAACQSLYARAKLKIAIRALDQPSACSDYGDTDQIINIACGDDPPPTANAAYTSRHAHLAGELVLHTTVGGRPEWRWGRVVITTWSRRDASREDVVLLDDEHIGRVVQYDGVVYGDGTLPTATSVVADARRWLTDLRTRIVSELAASYVRALSTDELKNIS